MNIFFNKRSQYLLFALAQWCHVLSRAPSQQVIKNMLV